MEHSVGVSQLDLVRPWRRATYIAGAVAGVELLLLLILGGMVVGPAIADALTGVAQDQVVAQAKEPKAAEPHKPKKVRAVASLPRAKTKVVVLNGNGRTGAAGEAADRVRARGYRIGVVGNADRSDYARSLVMYRGGFRGEAERLARDLGIRVVAPLDGMRPGELRGAHAVVVLGVR
jgi:LytR cell envelope-related transcriptional attenuator